MQLCVSCQALSAVIGTTGLWGASAFDAFFQMEKLHRLSGRERIMIAAAQLKIGDGSLSVAQAHAASLKVANCSP